MITTYTYDRANRLKQKNAGGTITTYTLDAAGNRIAETTGSESVTYQWDAAGRMVAAEVTSGTVTFIYNTDGQRTAKQATDGSATGFLYDYKRLLHETDEVGGDITKSYAVGTDEEYGDLIGEDGEMIHQYDAQANTNALLDNTGLVAAQYKYRAFGQVAAVSVEGGVWTSFDTLASLTANEWGSLSVDAWAELPVELTSNMLAGGRKQYYLDPETELYLLGMGTTGRYYDPKVGKFISEDPIRHEAGDPNLLRYVKNNPVNHLDPSGHDDDSDEARKKAEEAARRQREDNQAKQQQHQQNNVPGEKEQEKKEQEQKDLSAVGTTPSASESNTSVGTNINSQAGAPLGIPEGSDNMPISLLDVAGTGTDPGVPAQGSATNKAPDNGEQDAGNNSNPTGGGNAENHAPPPATQPAAAATRSAATASSTGNSAPSTPLDNMKSEAEKYLKELRNLREKYKNADPRAYDLQDQLAASIQGKIKALNQVEANIAALEKAQGQLKLAKAHLEVAKRETEVAKLKAAMKANGQNPDKPVVPERPLAVAGTPAAKAPNLAVAKADPNAPVKRTDLHYTPAEALLAMMFGFGGRNWAEDQTRNATGGDERYLPPGGQRDADNARAINEANDKSGMTRTAHTIEGVAKALPKAAGMIALSIVAPEVAISIAVIGLNSAATSRVGQGQTSGQAAIGALLDVTGYTELHEGITGHEPVTGKDLHLTEAQRGELQGSGGVGVLTTIASVAAGVWSKFSGDSAGSGSGSGKGGGRGSGEGSGLSEGKGSAATDAGKGSNPSTPRMTDPMEGKVRPQTKRGLTDDEQVQNMENEGGNQQQGVYAKAKESTGGTAGTPKDTAGTADTPVPKPLPVPGNPNFVGPLTKEQAAAAAESGAGARPAWLQKIGVRPANPTSFEDVASHLKENGSLPENFITKDQAKALGWDPKKGNLHDVAPGKSIGGDVFQNKGEPLPTAPGRVWREADANYSGGFRGSDRILYSNDGLIYKTTDHYKTFTQVTK